VSSASEALYYYDEQIEECQSIIDRNKEEINRLNSSFSLRRKSMRSMSELNRNDIEFDIAVRPYEREISLAESKMATFSKLRNDVVLQTPELYYEQLLQEKNVAYSEDGFSELAEKFRSMNGYNDTIALAQQCERQYQALKNHRISQEQADKKEKQNQLKIEANERAVIARRRKITKYTGLALQIGLLVGYAILLADIENWTDGGNSIGLLILVFVLYPLIISVISSLFHRGMDYPAALVIIILTIILKSITAGIIGISEFTEFTNAVAFILVFFGVAILSLILAIPGLIVAGKVWIS